MRLYYEYEKGKRIILLCFALWIEKGESSMEDQSFFSAEPSRDDQKETAARANGFQRVWRAWLRLSGPKREHFSASLEDQERLRRSRLLSAILPLTFIAALITIPTAIPVPTYWMPILTLFVLCFVAFLLNRAAYINLSAIFIIIAIDAAIIIDLATLPTGIASGNLADFDLLVIATLIGGIVLPRRLLPFLAIWHILLIFILFAWLPRDPLLTLDIEANQKGFAYNEISDAILLQIIGAYIAWWNAWGVDKALVRASKAEELAAAQRTLNEQARLQVEQKERLEYGISVLKEAHARFANGDYRARAHLYNNELASLAFSFNLMAERLNRVAQTAQKQERLEQAFQRLFSIQEDVIYGGTLKPLVPTETVVDRIYPWLKQYYQFRQVYARCGATVERSRLCLVRQKTLLSQLSSTLDQMHSEIRVVVKDPQLSSAALTDIEKARSLCERAEEQGKLGLQENKQLEQLLKV